MKQVQIAHISHDSSDSRYENLVVLCLDHHDQYDSPTSQSKGFTPDELRQYKYKLEDLIRSWDLGPHQIAVPHVLADGLSVGTSSVRVSPPVPSFSQPRDIDILTFFSTLLDPFQREKAQSLLVENDFLSKEIEKIEKVLIRTDYNPYAGKPYCIIVIGDNLKWTWDVLLFLQHGSKWSRIGRIPLRGQKGEEPVITYIPGETEGALGIEHVSSYGTGVFQKETTWYRVGSEGLVPLFSYPVLAYIFGWNLPFQRHISGYVTSKPYVLKPKARLEIALKAKYSAEELWLEKQGTKAELPLFSDSARLVLEWNAQARFFVPTKESTATFEQVEKLFDNGTDDFIRKYEAEIINLARNGNNNQRKWVEYLVSQATPNDECMRVKSEIKRVVE